jgi:hypothetical protein
MRELIVTQTGDITRQVSYSAVARIALATVRVAAAAGSAYAGTRPRRPGPPSTVRPVSHADIGADLAVASHATSARPACLASRP